MEIKSDKKCLEINGIDIPQTLMDELVKLNVPLVFVKCNFGEVVFSGRSEIEIRECSWKKITSKTSVIHIHPDRLSGTMHHIDALNGTCIYHWPPSDICSETGVHYRKGEVYRISGFPKVEFLKGSIVERDIEFVNQPPAQVYFDETSRFTGKIINGRLVSKRWDPQSILN